MPTLKQPVTLEKLALIAVSEYVHTIGQTVFKAMCNKVTDPPLTSEEKTEKQKFNLEPLSAALYRDIPHVLWFEVTTYVLIAINKLIGQVQCSLDGFRTTGHRRCKDFIEELLLALIAPHVTHLDFTDHVPFSRLFLAKNLDKMQHIRGLNLLGVKSAEVVTEHLAFLTYLTSFTMEQQCTDEIIHILALNCKKLQTLNVTGSLGVTDKSTVNILKFQNLQHLYISCTKISQMGVLCILSQAKEISDYPLKDTNTLKNLESLGCGQICNEQLHAITQSFLKLTRISLSTVRCDFKILSELKHLKEFKVSCGHFGTDNMAGLFQAIGPQLEKLDLLMVQDVDLCVIATHCVNLNTLSLRSCHVEVMPQLPRYFKSDKGVPFHKVEHLTFYVTYDDIKLLEFVLVRCFALRTLVIGQMRGVDDNFISSCLSANPLKELEIFRMYFGGQISLRSVHLLLESCPKLAFLGGLHTSSKIDVYDLTLLVQSLKRKNYNISIL